MLILLPLFSHSAHVLAIDVTAFTLAVACFIQVCRLITVCCCPLFSCFWLSLILFLFFVSFFFTLAVRAQVSYSPSSHTMAEMHAYDSWSSRAARLTSRLVVAACVCSYLAIATLLRSVTLMRPKPHLPPLVFGFSTITLLGCIIAEVHTHFCLSVEEEEEERERGRGW